jgi:CheY-like chemotaxis protein
LNGGAFQADTRKYLPMQLINAAGAEKVKSFKVLVADDDADSRLLLEKVLEKRGYETCAAERYEDALAALLDDDGPALVLLDRMMPGGDGLEACRQYRARRKAGMKYIILITARSGVKDIVDGLAAGANDYLTKPFDKEELLARLGVGERFLELNRELEFKITELSAALGHVKKLQGLLPICMHCHKIRTDKASWQRIESYLSEHAEVRFSHGICPDCEKKYYKDVMDQEGAADES